MFPVISDQNSNYTSHWIDLVAKRDEESEILNRR